MNRTSEQSRLPRHLRRQFHKLIRRNSCSICGNPFKHNTCTGVGLDAAGNVVLACEGCISRVAKIFTMGFYQNAPAATDKLFDDMVQRGGDMSVTPKLNLSNSPWKKDDADWFEQNPKRSHRVRMPFPGEVDKEAARTTAGYVEMIMVQQTAPGRRLRGVVDVNTDLLPLPNDEAASHALFEAAMGREVLLPDRQSLDALIQKYKTQEPGQ